MSEKKIKTVKNETIEEQPLPDLTQWEDIGGRPTSLKDIDRNIGEGAYWDEITETEIADNSISTPKLQANAVTANEMFVNQLSAISANLGEVTAGTVTGATIQTSVSGFRIRLESDPQNKLQFLEDNNIIGNLSTYKEGDDIHLELSSMGGALDIFYGVGASEGYGTSVSSINSSVNLSGASNQGEASIRLDNPNDLTNPAYFRMGWYGGSFGTRTAELGNIDLYINQDLTVYGDAHMGIVDIDDLQVEDMLTMNGRIEMNGNSILDVGTIIGSGAGFTNFTTNNLSLDGDEVKVESQTGYLYV